MGVNFKLSPSSPPPPLIPERQVLTKIKIQNDKEEWNEWHKKEDKKKEWIKKTYGRRRKSRHLEKEDSKMSGERAAT